MKEPTKVIEIGAGERKAARFCRFSRSFVALPRSLDVPSLRWQHSPSEQIQIRQREGREQAYRILHQPAVANFVEAPQALDHVEYMFDAGPCGGAAAADEPLVLAQVRASAG